MLQLTRREALGAGAGAFAVTALGIPAMAAESVEEAIKKFTGGSMPGEGDVELTAPEIAENGNTVPIEVSADGAVAIALFADGNPEPDVCIFNFGPLAGSSSAATRIRLAKTQNVVAVAKYPDGSAKMAKALVKVTIGGCGG